MLTNNANIFEGGLDERSKAYLLETTRWTKFLAIMGFIGIGFMIIMAFVYFLFGSAMYAQVSGLGSMGSYMGIGMGLFMLLIVALYIFPIVSLLKFSNNMKVGIKTNNVELITEAFRHQKNLYKFIGILTIIGIAVYLLLIVAMGIVGITAATR